MRNDCDTLLKPNNSSVQCSTRDSPPYRYMIPQYTDIERFFSINSEDGLITTTKPLDRETQAWHNISVSATEIGTHRTFPQRGEDMRQAFPRFERNWDWI